MDKQESSSKAGLSLAPSSNQTVAVDEEYMLVRRTPCKGLPLNDGSTSSTSSRITAMRPSRAQLAALPYALPSQGKRAPRAKGGKNSKITTRIVGKFYNPVAGRPCRAVTTQDNSILVTLTNNSPPSFSTSTTVPTFLGYYAALSQFSASNYTALFDQYRIEQLELWLEPENTNAICAELATCVDYDDANAPGSIANVADRQDALVGMGAAGRYHKWVPHVAVAAYSGTFTSFINEPAPWVDSASTGVQHYGFKIAALATPSSVVNYLITVRAVVRFRGCNIS